MPAKTRQTTKNNTNTKKATTKTTTASKKAVSKVNTKNTTPKRATKKATKTTTPKRATKKATRKTTKKATKKTKTTSQMKAGNKNGKRYFKVVLDGTDKSKAHGRFSGNKPKQAAGKALSSLAKDLGKNKKPYTGQIKYSIIECTRGSKNKCYNYVGQRKPLDTPTIVTIGKGDNAKQVSYKYKNVVRKNKNA